MNPVNLKLTEEEARLLSWIMASIGGDMRTSGRVLAENIQEKLCNIGMHYTIQTENKFPMDEDRQTIHFV